MNQSSNFRAGGQAGTGLVELLVSMGVLMILMGLVFQSFATLTRVTARESTQSDATSKARGAMETVVNSLRHDFVQFNTVAGAPLGVNFDLDDGSGNPVVRDGLLYYIDRNHTAQIYNTTGGKPFSAGLDDADVDGKADLIGIGLVPQNLRLPGYGNNGLQDFVDLNNDGLADDLDGDGIRDPLWNFTMVRLSRVDDVSNAALWRQGQILSTNLYIRRLVPTGTLSGSNTDTFRFSAHNPIAMLYDTIANGGNANAVVDENEIGNIDTADGIINAANEVASIDSITITMHIAETAYKSNGRIVVLGDISSDLITPRTLELMRLNGIIGIPDPTKSGNIN